MQNMSPETNDADNKNFRQESHYIRPFGRPSLWFLEIFSKIGAGALANMLHSIAI